MASTTAAPTAPAPVQGAADYQRFDFLPAEIGLPWFDALADKHRASVVMWSERVEGVADLLDEADDEQAEHRAAVRAALQAGKPTPPALDPVAAAMKLSLAQEDVCRAEEQLAETTVACLAVLRTRRSECEPHLGSFGDALVNSITRGPGGRTAVIAEELRRRLKRLDALQIAGIEDLSTTTEQEAA